MAYIGNGPGVASQRITTTLTATASQTTFTPTSGYTVGYIDVYLNGVRLVNGTDYTASNGTTVVLASGAAENDVMEIVAYLPRGLSDGYTKAEADNRYMSASATTLPSQTDNSGKFLTTDGTDASWATINVSPTPASVSDQANASTGYFDLPAGTTAQRPGSPASGMVRFNTETGEPEWYDPAGSQWLGFSKGSDYNVEYLVIAGGGGGGSRISGGGGAGGYRSSVSGESSGGGASAESGLTLSSGTTYTVTVGAGGPGSGEWQTRGSNGDDSVFSSVTSTGGGGGGSWNVGSGLDGGSGGSGGGASGSASSPARVGGARTTGQGYAGGNGAVAPQYGGGGGGGAGGVGGTGTANGGNGGNGVTSSITGSPVPRGGGGGGGVENAGTPGSGGTGGGGNASGPGSSANGGNGTVNTGGGGGSAGNTGSSAGNGGAGGDGIVIVRYAGAQRGTGGTVTSAGGYTIHTFTSSGSFIA
jgi:hypothetical protein